MRSRASSGKREPSRRSRTRTSSPFTSPRFSPDGLWIAYESDESGSPEVYVALSQGGGEKRRISPGGGRRPLWRRDGKELYYVGPGDSVMAVSVTPRPHWAAGAPASLFQADAEVESYDVTPDGSRFLVSMPLERVRESPLRVILNWPAALGRGKQASPPAPGVRIRGGGRSPPWSPGRRATSTPPAIAS